MVVSALYELPPGRQPVATQVVTDDEGGQQAMYEAIRTELAAGMWLGCMHTSALVKRDIIIS
jgi:RecG-like helicase